MATSFVSTNFQTQSYRTEVKRTYTKEQRLARIDQAIQARRDAGLSAEAWQAERAKIESEARG